MAAASPPVAAPPKATAGKVPLRPPEEKFWVRYSPHHELPVSAAGSFLLHVVGFGLLGLILIGVIKGIGNVRPVEVGMPVAIEPTGGGGGNPRGIGDGPNTGILPTGKEAVQPDVREPLVSAGKAAPAPLREVDKTPPALADVASERLIQEQTTDTVLGQLSDIGQQARKNIEGRIAGRGKGGSGSGGGDGSGIGTGTGPGTGSGKAGIDTRTSRQQRWVMIFNTTDGNDYLRQLQHLGAIVAVPQPGGGYVVYRDLTRRPLKGEVEDVGTINRIYWVDDKPHSVESLTRAMGIQPTPTHIAAFFPETLEGDLRRKEQTHYRGKEENIEETRFHIVRRGAKYEPVIVMKPKLKGQ